MESLDGGEQDEIPFEQAGISSSKGIFLKVKIGQFGLEGVANCRSRLITDADRR